jgi:hypothetical protein
MMMSSIRHITYCIIGFCIANTTLAQETPKVKSEKKSKLTLYAGVGPNFYFNNVVVGKSGVNEFNYSFVTRLMWEPEHFLSLGFETGYNRLYTVNLATGASNETHIVNAVIPIQGMVSMKFLKHFYGNFSMGQGILLNKVHTANNGDVNASVISLGDFGAGIGYRKLVQKKWFLGAELKGYYSTKLDDKNIGLIFMAGYKL